MTKKVQDVNVLSLRREQNVVHRKIRRRYHIFVKLKIIIQARPNHHRGHGNGHRCNNNDNDNSQQNVDHFAAALQQINTAGCGAQRIRPAMTYIVGGTEAAANSWPWMVSCLFVLTICLLYFTYLFTNHHKWVCHSKVVFKRVNWNYYSNLFLETTVSQSCSDHKNYYRLFYSSLAYKK